MSALIDTEMEMLDELARDFAAKELEEKREENDRYPFGPFFEGVLEKAREVGFFSIMLPEELGGAGKGVGALSLVLEDICRVDASLGGIMFTCALATEIVMGAGGEEVLKGAVDEDATLLAFPAFDNPRDNLGLVAEMKSGDTYSLSGSVDYVVLGGFARNALLPAKISDREGYSFFLIDLSGDGVEISAPVLSLGLHSCPAVDLALEGADGRIVGEEGKGEAYYEDAADKMSVAAAAMALGVMRGSFDEALSYTKERRQGGREIVDWSEVRMMLAGMAIKVRASEMIVTGARRAVDAAEPGWRMSSRAAALHVGETACEVTPQGIQLLGGNGYMEEYGQEKRFRDATQIQALMGICPMRRLDYMRRVLEGQRVC